MKPNDGGPAFPKTEYAGDTDAPFNQLPGMSMRDYFAGRALQAMASNPSDESADFNPEWEGYKGGVPEEYAGLAKRAYLMADAMLAERAKERP